jgi:hypothetical protein
VPCSPSWSPSSRPLRGGQETPPGDPGACRGPAQAAPYRPIEGNVIIDLPSVEVPRAGTLTMLFTHRFQQPVQDSTIHDLWSFDNGAHIGIGLWYAPIKGLNVGFYRSSELDVYEATAQYQLPYRGRRLRGVAARRRGLAHGHRRREPALVVLRAGDPRVQLRPYVRVSALPTFLQRTNQIAINRTVPPPNDESCRAVQVGVPPVTRYNCSGLYENLFNVPFAASIAITRTITVHGEVTPSLGKANSQGVAWIVSVEKALLRHRFAFTAGNQRRTTVDQYAMGIPLSGNRPEGHLPGVQHRETVEIESDQFGGLTRPPNCHPERSEGSLLVRDADALASANTLPDRIRPCPDLPELTVPSIPATRRLVELPPAAARRRGHRTPARRKTSLRVALRGKTLACASTEGTPASSRRTASTTATSGRRTSTRSSSLPSIRRTLYFEFEVNPLGTLFDARVDSPGLVRAGMQRRHVLGPGGAARDGRQRQGGGPAALAIPLEELWDRSRSRSAGARNFYRVDRGAPSGDPDEFSAWSPILKDARGLPRGEESSAC